MGLERNLTCDDNYCDWWLDWTAAEARLLWTKLNVYWTECGYLGKPMGGWMSSPPLVLIAQERKAQMCYLLSESVGDFSRSNQSIIPVGTRGHVTTTYTLIIWIILAKQQQRLNIWLHDRSSFEFVFVYLEDSERQGSSILLTIGFFKFYWESLWFTHQTLIHW